jgi:hypothetical protein
VTDELEPGDSLDRVVNTLRQPVPILPGLERRAGERLRRRRTTRVVRGIAALVLLAGLIGVAVLRRPSETSVTFAITAPSVRSIALVGDFTDWRSDRVQLKRTGGGLWEATVRLHPGQYRFAYLVDHDQWRADSRAATAPDDFGRPTSVLTVVAN